MAYNPSEARDESGRWTAAQVRAARRERAKAVVRKAKAMAKDDVSALTRAKTKAARHAAMRRIERGDDIYWSRGAGDAPRFWRFYAESVRARVQGQVSRTKDRGKRYSRHLENARRVLEGRRTREDYEDDLKWAALTREEQDQFRKDMHARMEQMRRNGGRLD